MHFQINLRVIYHNSSGSNIKKLKVPRFHVKNLRIPGPRIWCVHDAKSMASFKPCHSIKKMEFPVEFQIVFWSEIIKIIIIHKLVISGHK